MKKEEKKEKKKNLRRELAQLMPDHVLGDGDVVVDLAVVDRELEADEVGQDGRGARLRADRAYPFAGRRAHDRESVFIFL